MHRPEFESLAELESALQEGASLARAVFQNLDLTSIESQLLATDLGGTIYLGCRLPRRLADHLAGIGVVVLPNLAGIPYATYRGALYTPDELMGTYEIGDAETYDRTLDGRIYAHYLATRRADSKDVFETLGRRLHDHAITDAVQELIAGRKVVAMMGGHVLRRDDPLYLETARLSRDLTQRGYFMTSGGGPGAMEATHLGAWFAAREDDELVAAVGALATAPLYKPLGAWLDAAFTVARRYPVTDADRCASLGIPTWLYGHEPPTCFALHIAKYFANSVREEGVLAIARHGVVFAPGSAGTIQEIFQDACQNHYESFGPPSPMIFFGQDYWTREKPVFPLLKQLAEGHEYGALLGITDDRREIVAQIEMAER